MTTHLDRPAPAATAGAPADLCAGPALAGRNVALVFEKASTRTRGAFEEAVRDVLHRPAEAR